MITVETKVKQEDGFILDFNGLSTDTKPTGTYEGMTIKNGSSFFEMDNKRVVFYDQATNDWV